MTSGFERPSDDADPQGFLLRLYDLLRSLADPREFAAEACRRLADWLAVDHAYYVEIDDASGTAQPDLSGLCDGAGPRAGGAVIAGFSWSVERLRHGQAQAIADARTSPLVPDADRAALLGAGIVASLCVPLTKQGTLVGALCASASAPRDWTPGEIALLQDVGERIWSAVEWARAEHERAVSETRYRTLVNAMDEAVCVLERLPPRADGLRDYRYLSMNPAMQEMFGLPDLSGRSIREGLPELVEDWCDLFDRALDGGAPIRIERGPCEEGHVLDMFVTRIEDETGRTLMTVIRDITERKRAETALRASEERLSALVNATSEVIYRMSPDWRKMLDIHGRGFMSDSWEPSADWLAEHIAPEDRPRVLAAIRKAIRTKSPFQMEHRFKRRDGSQGWAFARAIPVLGADGEIVEWFGAASDITERRQTVEALMHTQGLDALGRLAGAIAHDFNNLLTVIVANIELAELQAGDGPARAFLDNAAKAAQLGKGINQRLLGWAGKSPTQRRVLNLNDLVSDLSRILDRSIGERVLLRLDLAGDLWPVHADPGHIDSALLNLIVNARDAMPQGGEIRLATANLSLTPERARAIPRAKAGDYVCLSVTDTGEGMTEDVRRHALEPFFSTKGHGTGVGLGLFSVQTMVQQSGGFLDFESAPGRGTSFRLYFPREESAEAERRPPAEAAPPPQDGRIRVLLVEDQEALREVTRERLQTLGYEVVEARDAEDALSRLRFDPEIRVVFSDIVMPGDLSGRDLARRVLAERPGIAVLLTSGFSAETAPATQEDPTAGLPLLVKPYSLTDLAEALEQTLGRTPRGAPPRLG